MHNQIKAGVPFDVFKYVCISKVVKAGSEWKWERRGKEGEGATVSILGWIAPQEGLNFMQ